MSDKYLFVFNAHQMSLKQGAENELREWENENWEQNRELEMKFQGLVPIFHFLRFSQRILVVGERCITL